jgi:hypothetical protein
MIITVIFSLTQIFFSKNTKTNTTFHKNTVAVHLKNKSTVKQSNKPTDLFANTTLNCSDSASIVQLTVDYIVTDMTCSSIKPAISDFLNCNGSIFSSASNISLDCYRTNYYSTQDQLQCDGSTTYNPNTSNLNLSYNCNLPGVINNPEIYACSGQITNYASHALNLPLVVNCTSV